MDQNRRNEAPGSAGVLIPGKRGRLFAHVYLPGGAYPRPVVLICHGIPGKERLFDFAVRLREEGFCTLSFHYSGSWGSDGAFSVSHCFEDCVSALDYIRKNENGWFDLNNVFMVGHSMGGLMTARMTAQEPMIRAGVILVPMDFRGVAEEALGMAEEGKYRPFIEDVSLWLRDMSWERFREDAAGNGEKMDLISYAPRLAEKPILTVAGGLDTLLPPEEHIDRLNAAIEACGKGKLTALRFETDHAFNLHRPEIRTAVADFLLGNIV